MNNFEKLDHPQFDLLEKAQMEMEKRRIKMEEFRGQPGFPDEDIDADVSACMSLRAKFEQNNKRLGTEKAALDQGKLTEWAFMHFLENHLVSPKGETRLIPTSLYDDFMRGMDSIAEILLEEGESEHLGLSLDFTTSAADIGAKLNHTFNQLDQGYTPSVKYFRTETEEGESQFIRNKIMPRIVLGASGANIDRIMHVYANNSDGKLSNDPFKFIMFGEIIAQLEVFCHRLEAVIRKANGVNPAIEKRAIVSLDIHKKAMQTVLKLAAAQGIKLGDIQKHIKGDATAMQIGVALGLLNQTPIEFKSKAQ